MVQGLGLGIFPPKGPGLIHGQRTEILPAARHSQKKKKKESRLKNIKNDVLENAPKGL